MKFKVYLPTANYYYIGSDFAAEDPTALETFPVDWQDVYNRAMTFRYSWSTNSLIYSEIIPATVYYDPEKPKLLAVTMTMPANEYQVFAGVDGVDVTEGKLLTLELQNYYLPVNKKPITTGSDPAGLVLTASIYAADDRCNH